MPRRPSRSETAGHDGALVVDIDSIAAGGDGVARAGGLVVFVPRSAPGDHVEIHARVHKSLARGEITRIITPSPQRTDPPCIHYTRDRCGGCQIQHLRYDAQRDAKGRIIRDALTRIARREASPPEVEASPEQWRYRRKLTFALRRRNGRWIMGLHPYDAPGAVFDVADCPITDERVMHTWAEIRDASADLPSADELRIAVRLLDERTASIVVEGDGHWPAHERFFARIPSAKALWWKRGTRSPRLLHERGDHEASASFAQVNPGMASRLHEYVISRAKHYEPKTLVDAYAGTGETAVPLAQSGIRVTAIELDEHATRVAAARLAPPSRAVAGRVEDVLAGHLPADVVLANPPRTGLDPAVTATLDRSGARALLYVSCNPATLARDIARMPGYRIAGVRAFDMFPQTAHVETVCELVPAGP